MREFAPDVSIRHFAGDVGVEDQVAAAVAMASDMGGLDIAVANAGIGTLAPIMVTTDESWRIGIINRMSQPPQKIPATTKFEEMPRPKWSAEVGGSMSEQVVLDWLTAR